MFDSILPWISQAEATTALRRETQKKNGIAVGTTVVFNSCWSFSIIQLPASLPFTHPLLYSHRIARILKYPTVATEADSGGGSLVHLACFHLGDPSYVAIQLFPLLEECLECLWLCCHHIGKDRYPEKCAYVNQRQEKLRYLEHRKKQIEMYLTSLFWFFSSLKVRHGRSCWY